MNIALWILQVLLALLFLYIGGTKVFSAIEALHKTFDWVNKSNSVAVRYIGICEVLGALGLILPALTHILTDLTIVAAIGLCLVMIYASIFHTQRKEYPNIAFNSVLFLLAAFVAFGRLVLAPL